MINRPLLTFLMSEDKLASRISSQTLVCCLLSCSKANLFLNAFTLLMKAVVHGQKMYKSCSTTHARHYCRKKIGKGTLVRSFGFSEIRMLPSQFFCHAAVIVTYVSLCSIGRKRSTQQLIHIIYFLLSAYIYNNTLNLNSEKVTSFKISYSGPA